MGVRPSSSFIAEAHKLYHFLGLCEKLTVSEGSPVLAEFPIDFLISGDTSSTKLERSMAGDLVVLFPGRAAADQYFPQPVGEDSVVLQLGKIRGSKDIDSKPVSNIDVLCRC